MADVFISYSRVDREIAQRVADLLEKSRISSWWDINLVPQDRFRDVVAAEIDTCYAALVLWSATSQGSDWVNDEAQRAKSQNKLIQITIDGTPPPLGFGGATNHIADFSAWNRGPAEQCFKDILTAIRRFLPERDDVDALRQELKHLREVVAGLQAQVTALQEGPPTNSSLDKRDPSEEPGFDIADKLSSLSLPPDQANSLRNGDLEYGASTSKLHLHDVRRLAGEWLTRFEVEENGPEPKVFRSFFIVGRSNETVATGSLVAGDRWYSDGKPGWHVLYGYALEGRESVFLSNSDVTLLGAEWEDWFEDLSREMLKRHSPSVRENFVAVGFSNT